MVRRGFILLCFIGSAFGFQTAAGKEVSPQTGNERTISGFVTDSSNGETLIGAVVRISGTKLGAVTNKNGYFVLRNIPSGKHTLTCAYVGYRTREIIVDVQTGDATMTFVLSPQDIQATDITIEVNKEDEQKEIKISSVDLSSAQIEQMPSIGESDLFRALQYLPGILTSSEISSGLYIRGGTPDQNLILLDGSTIYNPNHLFGFFSTFNTDAIKDVELIKGGFPAEYGGRLSSVINVTNRDGNQNNFKGQASLGLIDSRLTLESPLGNGSILVSGRRTYADLILALLPKDPTNPLPDYYFYDLTGKITQNFGQNDKVFISAYGGADNLLYNTGALDFGMNWGNGAGAARWTHIFSDKIFSDLNVTASKYNSGFNGNEGGSNFSVFNSIQDITAKGSVEYYATDEHTFKFGFETSRYTYMYQQNYLGSGDSASSSPNDSSNVVVTDWAVSFYAQDAWQITPLLSMQFGLRSNWTRQSSAFTWDPRFSLRYILSDIVTLKASWGIYHQYLHLAARPDFEFFSVWLPTDSTVPAEEAIQYIFGVETHPLDGWDFNIDLYYKPLINVAEFKPYVYSGTTVNQIFSIGTGKAYGAEFFLQKKMGPFTGWIGYTLSWVTEQYSDINNGISFPPPYDRRNDIDVILSWRINSRWRVGAAWTFTTGQPYTAATSEYSIALPGQTISSEYTLPGAEDALRLPPNHRLDASAAYQTTIFGLASTFNLNIFNVYDYREIWFRYYDTSKNPTQVTDVLLLPIIPTFSLEVKF